MVLIDSYVHTPQFCNVGLEDFTGSYNATHYLIQKGHRHIAFASPNIKDGGVLQERFLGYKAALAEASIPFDKSIVFQQEMDIESCKLVCEDIVKHPEITGMVVSADIMAARSVLGAVFDDDIYKLDGAAYHKKLTKQFGGIFSRLFNAEYKQLITDLRLCKKDGKKPAYNEAVSMTERLPIISKRPWSLLKLKHPSKRFLGKPIMVSKPNGIM